MFKISSTFFHKDMNHRNDFYHSGRENIEPPYFYAKISDLPDFMTDDTFTERNQFVMVLPTTDILWTMQSTSHSWDNDLGAILTYFYATTHDMFKNSYLRILWM